MNFIHSGVLYLIPLVIILAAAMFVSSSLKRRKLLVSILGSRVDEEGAVSLSKRMRITRMVLLVLVMVLLIIVWARPYWSRSLTPEIPRGRDIIILFDVSKSMLSDDVAPSRLEHGKFLLRQLTSSSNEDRFGIAAFAGTSYLACPLTSNRTALNEYIDELNCDLVPVGGTNLGAALKNAFRAFKAAEGNHRAIVLITDGDELTGDAKKEIEKLKELKIPVFVAGIGDTSGVPVRDSSGNIVRTSDGKIATTRLNETLLKSIAAATGGSYIRSTATNPGVENIINQINRLDKAERDGIKRTLPIDKFPGFLTAAFVLYLIYMLLSERKMSAAKKPAKTIILLTCALFPSLYAEENGSEVKKNDGMTVHQLYNSALDEQIKGKDAAGLYAETLHKAGNNPVIQSKSYYNLAVQSHSAARKNIAEAEKMISSQQLDAAEKTLGTAEQSLNDALPNYSTAFSYGGDIEKSNLSTENLTAHYLDLKKVKELKDKIKELKKQQQKARQDAKNAQQKNRDQKQNQQQKQQAINQAKQSASDLKDQAQKMDQKDLQKKAEQAEESLKKAEKSNKENKKEETQKHLDDAVRALGGDEQKQQKKENHSQNQQSKSDKDKDKGKDKPLDKPLDKQPQSGNAKEQEKAEKIDKRSAEQLLDMLKKDEQQRRKELLNRSRRRNINVEKDW